MTTEKIAVSGRVELKHFQEYSSAVRPRLRSTSRKVPWVLWAFAAGYAIVTFALMRFADHNVGSAALGGGVGGAEVAVISLLAGSLMTSLLLFFHGRQQYAQMLRDDGSYLGERQFIFDEAGSKITAPNSETLIAWRAFTDITEGVDTILMWTDPGAAVMVPRAAFPSDTALEAVKGLATSQGITWTPR